MDLLDERACAAVNEDVECVCVGGVGGGSNYSLREMDLSWKERSLPYLSWSENNFLYVANV